MNTNTIHDTVRSAYAKVAKQSSSCCGGGSSCGPDASTMSQSLGYTHDELNSVPESANLGLGCGHPTAIAGIKPGETVLDLGSGPGLDAFLASNKVGSSGHVIGVDMTPEMIARASAAAREKNIQNVEFRLGSIEELPVESNSIDLVISNCVINLAADKPAVFREILRVLKPGGRVAVSDTVLLSELPDETRGSEEALAGCLGGALLFEDYAKILRLSGLRNLRMTLSEAWSNGPVASLTVEGRK